MAGVLLKVQGSVCPYCLRHRRRRSAVRAHPREAEEAARREPELAAFLMTTILNHDTLESAVVASRRRAARSPGASGGDDPPDVRRGDRARDPTIGEAFRADIIAVADRDPACMRMIEPLLYFKGFQAIQAYRLSHCAVEGRPAGFRALPAEPRLGGVRRRHQSGRAHRQGHIPRSRDRRWSSARPTVIEDDVSILQGVTLGGTGKETGDRHPKIRHGVLIGAGARCSAISRSAIALAWPRARWCWRRCRTTRPSPACRRTIVGEAGCAEPARSMNQILAEKAIDV